MEALEYMAKAKGTDDPSSSLTAECTEEAGQQGLVSFASKFSMGRQKEERDRGGTIASSTREVFAHKLHFTVAAVTHGLCQAGAFLVKKSWMTRHSG